MKNSVEWVEIFCPKHGTLIGAVLPRAKTASAYCRQCNCFYTRSGIKYTGRVSKKKES